MLRGPLGALDHQLSCWLAEDKCIARGLQRQEHRRNGYAQSRRCAWAGTTLVDEASLYVVAKLLSGLQRRSGMAGDWRQRQRRCGSG